MWPARPSPSAGKFGAIRGSPATCCSSATRSSVHRSRRTRFAQATADIERALEFAIDAWNYRITEATPGSFTLTLVDKDETVLAAAPAPFASATDAAAARERAISHLYTRYSVEGFHMVETLLLRPQAAGDTFLAIPISDTQSVQDPYSHRLVLILPSGYERDFADDAAAPAAARPHRFRDPEFRRHAEGMVRQSCPAHILPQIRWVHRQAPGTAASDRSFDSFEPRYFDWLRTIVIDGANAAAATAARNSLVAAVNAIMSG